MNRHTYFLVNDTRYDNHHGGQTVIGNLHLGMAQRGWTCAGSLPVSSTVRGLRHRWRQVRSAGLVIVNGEGSLHHDSRQTRRLHDICAAISGFRPMALINAVWQDNRDPRWKPLLDGFAAVYARDLRSRGQLRELGVAADYAPDLTFYAYPQPDSPRGDLSGCTDSVLNSWTQAALRLCEREREMVFLPLLTGTTRYTRGLRDLGKQIKYRLYPLLWRHLGIRVPPRYQSLPHAIPDTGDFLRQLAACRAVCAARYHALCFALQQNTPFIAVASNSHKSEALLEEAGLPEGRYLMHPADIRRLPEILARTADGHAAATAEINEFKRRSRQRINHMFDRLTRIA